MVLIIVAEHVAMVICGSWRLPLNLCGWFGGVGQGGTGWNSKLLSCQTQLQFRRLIFCCGLIEVVSVISKGLENSQHLFVLRLYGPKQMARTPGFKER